MTHPSSNQHIYTHNPLKNKQSHPYGNLPLYQQQQRQQQEEADKENHHKEMFLLSRAYASLKSEYETLFHNHKILEADYAELRQKEKQQQMIMKAQQEAHQKNLTLKLPGEQELEDMKEKIRQLEEERDQELIPEIERLKTVHQDSIENHGQHEKLVQKLQNEIQRLNAEMELERTKSKNTIAIQERANTTLRRKNAKIFSQLMSKKTELQDEKNNKFEDKKTINRLQQQLDRCHHWSDQFKSQMVDETKNLQKTKHKTLKLDSMLQHEWLNAREREKLIAELTDENLYLRHCNRVLQDQIDMPAKPLDQNIESLFYKNVQEQLRNMESYLDLKPVEGEQWVEEGPISYLRAQQVREQQRQEVSRYLDEIERNEGRLLEKFQTEAEWYKK